MFQETSYSEPTFGMGFNWGSFIGGIGGALNQALGGQQYGQIPQGQYGRQPTQQELAYCTQMGTTWNAALGRCNTPINQGNSDVAFSGSMMFWIIGGIVAVSLLSKRR